MRTLSRDEIKKIIIEMLVPLGISRISLFGSFARGEIKPGSDIDILVRLRPSSQRGPIGLRWFMLDSEISEKLGMPVDLVSEDALSPLLRPMIEKDLEVIYDEAG